MEENGLLLYIDIPFCPVHCPYCTRRVHNILSNQGMRFPAALEREAAAAAADFKDYTIKAVWIGGGIAGHMFDEQLGILLKKFHRWFSMDDDVEITLKVHPGMVSAATLDACNRGGITRMSIEYATGITPEYQRLGRFLDPNAMEITSVVLKGSRLERSFDILLGIPGQTGLSVKRSIRNAIAYGAAHISLHMMRGGDKLAPEIFTTLNETAAEVLSANGFINYLPGRYALPGHECRYFQYEEAGMEYAGFGPGAHSFMYGIHSVNSNVLETYLDYSDNPERLIASYKRLS